MTIIIIKEAGNPDENLNATVSFDHRGEYPVTIRNPFTPEEEQQLSWYFEEYLSVPFLEPKARSIPESIRKYGEELFNQVFRDKKIYSQYSDARKRGLETIRIQISGSPDFFHMLHWETLKDPRDETPLVLDASMIRTSLIPKGPILPIRESPVIRILVITARPNGRDDVGYRTISRPLVNSLRQANLHVKIDFVRPGTWEALQNNLDETRRAEGIGYYQIIHFDTHGGICTYDELQKGIQDGNYLFQARYGRSDIRKYDDRKAFLFFDSGISGKWDYAQASEVAELLKNHGIPVAILNACQSGMEIGSGESSLGSRLLDAGVQIVLAMSYSISVTAATELMTKVYQELFRGIPLFDAIRRGRRELYNKKQRTAYFNSRIDLEDWLLPVVYFSGDPSSEFEFPLREFSFDEQSEFYRKRAFRFTAPRTTYEFVGRDIDILEIEKKLLAQQQGNTRNLLMVRGMGGCGKTTLLCHLGEWWQTTGLVEEVFYFGYDEKAWNLNQIIDTVALQLFGVHEDTQPSSRQYQELIGFRLLTPIAQQEKLAEMLRSKRHLIILDNLESITEENLTILNTLSYEDKKKIRKFLTTLYGGKTLVLLGTRGDEYWLVSGQDPPLQESDIYQLHGLDPEAASILADRVLTRNVLDLKLQEDYRKSDAFSDLMRLLAGYPLAIEVVFSNLKIKSPVEILSAFKSGAGTLDLVNSEGSKTESILKCIEYSSNNLSQEYRQLLFCLAPFTSVLNTVNMKRYIQKLQTQFSLKNFPLNNIYGLLKTGINWGLLVPHETKPRFLRIHPTFPYFIRSRTSQVDPAISTAVNFAFLDLYKEYGRSLYVLTTLKEEDHRNGGIFIIGLEYENLLTALDIALNSSESISNLLDPLLEYLEINHDYISGLELVSKVVSRLEEYPVAIIEGKMWREFSATQARIGHFQLLIHNFEDAEISYQKALVCLQQNQTFDETEKRKASGIILHQIGVVAGDLGKWPQAEHYYQKALEIAIEFNNRDLQSRIYHQQGIAAQSQRQLPQAEQHYQKALAIAIEMNDRDLQSKVYQNLGAVTSEQGQWLQAEQYFWKALDIAIEIDDRDLQSGIYHNLGVVARILHQWPRAELNYQKALEIAIEINDRNGQAETFLELGTVAMEQDQWPQAEQYYLKSLEMGIEIGDFRIQSFSYHQLGMVAHKQGQWSQAETYYKKSLKFKIANNDRFEQAKTYYLLGIIAIEQGRWPQAQENLLQSLCLNTEFEDIELGADIMVAIHKLLIESNDDSIISGLAKLCSSTEDEVRDLLNEM